MLLSFPSFIFLCLLVKTKSLDSFLAIIFMWYYHEDLMSFVSFSFPISLLKILAIVVWSTNLCWSLHQDVIVKVTCHLQVSTFCPSTDCVLYLSSVSTCLVLSALWNWKCLNKKINQIRKRWTGNSFHSYLGLVTRTISGLTYLASSFADYGARIGYSNHQQNI